MEKEPKKAFKQSAFNSRDRRKHGRKSKIAYEMLALKKIDGQEIEDLEKRITEEAPARGVKYDWIKSKFSSRLTQLLISESNQIRKKKNQKKKYLRKEKIMQSSTLRQKCSQSCHCQNEL
jgi:hypothetical protein